MFVFNADKANNADGGNRITTGGYYTSAVVKEAVCLKGNDMSEYIHFIFESNGMEVSFDLYYKQKNGEPHYQENKIHSFMGLTGVMQVGQLALVTIEAFGKQVQGNRVNEFIGKTVNIRVQREEYVNMSGEVKYRMNLLNFIGADNKTFSEKTNNKEAKTYLVPVEDVIREKKSTPSNNGGGQYSIPGQNNAPNFTDDDMPF